MRDGRSWLEVGDREPARDARRLSFPPTSNNESPITTNYRQRINDHFTTVRYFRETFSIDVVSVQSHVGGAFGISVNTRT
jgi:hypothetical protein